MMIEGLFFILGGVILISLIGLILIRQVVHAAFLLIVILISLAGIYVLFGAEYLAVTQLLVYAGGVVILLAFGVMLTQQVREGASLSGHHLIFPGLLLVATVGFALTRAVTLAGEGIVMQMDNTERDSVRLIGRLFMTDYLLGFELIAFLLLVVLVGASYFARQSSKEKSI